MLSREEAKKVILKNRLVDDKTGCWEWTKYRGKWGYGRYFIQRKPYGAHRLSAYAFKNFDIHSKLFVCHHCDNPCCTNPEHLFIGTSADNLRDMVQKGRGPRGEANGNSKLNEEQVAEIKKLLRAGHSNSSIAAKFNIGGSNISAIKLGDRWGHLYTEEDRNFDYSKARRNKLLTEPRKCHVGVMSYPNAQGERNWQAKLTEQQAVDILKHLNEGEKHRIVAEKFGISISLVSHIKSGRKWKHLKRKVQRCAG